MSNTAPLILFPDTNILLHYKPIAEIDWLAVTARKACVIAIAPIVLAELEKAKALHPSSKLRERAKRVIAGLLDAADGADPIMLRPKVGLMFVDHEPGIDFAAARLAADIADDRLIASALDLHRGDQVPVAIVTADAGLIIKLRSRPVEIVRLDDTKKLPALLDEEQKEVRDLKAKVARLELRRPALQARFADGTLQLTLARRSPPIEPPSLAAQRIAHPHLTTDTAARHRLDLSVRMPRISVINLEHLADYNRALDAYFEAYAQFLEDHAAWAADDVCLFELGFIVANMGHGPATNIDIHLALGQGCEWVDPDDRTPAPEPPKPPQEQQPFGVSWARVGEPVSLARPWHHAHMSAPHQEGMITISGGSDMLSYGVHTLKHECHYALDPVLLFISPASASTPIRLMATITCNEGDKAEHQLLIIPPDYI